MIESYIERCRRAREEHNRPSAFGGERPAIGWLCSYVPEELLHAAGAQPVRLLGNAEVGITTDGYLPATFCSLVRSVFEGAMQGQYAGLRGAVFVATCDHMRQLFDLWTSFAPTPFNYILSLPRKATERTRSMYLGELRHLKTALEEFFGRPIEDGALRQAIVLHNETRRLLRQVYALQQASLPALSGAELIALLHGAGLLPRAEYNELLRGVIAAAPSRRRGPVGPRIMVDGSFLGEPELVGLLEHWGAGVVVDNLCIGSQTCWTLVEEEGDPLTALAKAYVERPPCARMEPMSRRHDHAVALAKEYRVDGVIYLQLKYCDPALLEFPTYLRAFEQAAIPVLRLERDHGAGALGQLQTRVQAFIEMLD